MNQFTGLLAAALVSTLFTASCAWKADAKATEACAKHTTQSTCDTADVSALQSDARCSWIKVGEKFECHATENKK